MPNKADLNSLLRSTLRHSPQIHHRNQDLRHRDAGLLYTYSVRQGVYLQPDSSLLGSCVLSSFDLFGHAGHLSRRYRHEYYHRSGSLDNTNTVSMGGKTLEGEENEGSGNTCSRRSGQRCKYRKIGLCQTYLGDS